MRGENVGITPRRSRSTVLQAQHQQQPVSIYSPALGWPLRPLFCFNRPLSVQHDYKGNLGTSLLTAQLWGFVVRNNKRESFTKTPFPHIIIYLQYE